MKTTFVGRSAGGAGPQALAAPRAAVVFRKSRRCIEGYSSAAVREAAEAESSVSKVGPAKPPRAHRNSRSLSLSTAASAGPRSARPWRAEPSPARLLSRPSPRGPTKPVARISVLRSAAFPLHVSHRTFKSRFPAFPTTYLSRHPAAPQSALTLEAKKPNGDSSAQQDSRWSTTSSNPGHQSDPHRCRTR